jgi:hypothetical protein
MPRHPTPVVAPAIRLSFAALRVSSVVAVLMGLALPMVAASAQEEPAPDPTPRPLVRRPGPMVAGLAQAEPRRRESSVEAPAMLGITIDGDLRDWPPAMPRYPIQKICVVPPFLGYGGLRNADLSTSPDLSAAFSVGYDPRKRLIYLAVIVRDDKLVVGNTSYLDSDAVEVYIDGLHSEKQIPPPNPGQLWWEQMDLSTVPVHQYVAIPGPGKVYGMKYDTNPILLAGDLRKTRTRMAFRRVGDVTTYEWAIQPFDRYPDEPTQLKPGKRIGFDLVVVDKDVPARSPRAMNEPEEDRAAWIYWGPEYAGMKAFRAGTLGEIVLGKLGGVLSTDRPRTSEDSERAGSASTETSRPDRRPSQDDGPIRDLGSRTLGTGGDPAGPAPQDRGYFESGAKGVGNAGDTRVGSAPG